jgi:Outer membrane protein beta-barrel domain
MDRGGCELSAAMRRLASMLPLIALVSALGTGPLEAQSLPRFTVAVNGGYQPTTTSFDDGFQFTVNQETGTTDTSYPIEAGALFDAGFSVRLWRGLGAGVAFSSFTLDGSLHATSSIPHPFVFSDNREASGDAGGIRRQEKAVHIQAQYLVPFGKVQVTLMGGPSVLDINQTVVTAVKYTEEYPYDAAAFAGVETRRVTGTKTGFNAGADVRWMFARHLGVGGLVRYTRATIDLQVDTRTITVDAGGAQVGAGVRIVF